MKKILIILIIVLIILVGYFAFKQEKILEPREEQEQEQTENEEELIEEFMTVKVFFGNSNLNVEAVCEEVFPIEREVPETQAVARAALEELLKGPTAKEESMGYFTNINEGVEIQSLIVENGTAKVDFNEYLDFQVGGSCRVIAIRAEIEETLKQFPTVENVIISINGRTDDILQP